MLASGSLSQIVLLPKQHLLQRRHQIQVIKNFMPRRTPVRQCERMRQQRLPRFSCITESHRHAGQKGNQRSLKGVLKQHRKIKLLAFPLAICGNNRKRSLPVVESMSSMKSASAKIPFAPGRITSVIFASGNTRRRARRAGTVITESPTQFVPRTTTRLILSACTLRHSQIISTELLAARHRLRSAAANQFVADCASDVRNITQRHRHRNRRIFLDHRFNIDHPADFFQYVAQAHGIHAAATQVIKSKLNFRFDKCRHALEKSST